MFEGTLRFEKYFDLDKPSGICILQILKNYRQCSLTKIAVLRSLSSTQLNSGNTCIYESTLFIWLWSTTVFPNIGSLDSCCREWCYMV
jgi:hypothetical protein